MTDVSRLDVSDDTGKRTDAQSAALLPLLERSVVIGQTRSGARCILALDQRSVAGHAQVLLLFHDPTRADVLAEPLGEYVALSIVRDFARREGLRVPFKALERRPRRAS